MTDMERLQARLLGVNLHASAWGADEPRTRWLLIDCEGVHVANAPMTVSEMHAFVDGVEHALTVAIDILATHGVGAREPGAGAQGNTQQPMSHGA